MNKRRGFVRLFYLLFYLAGIWIYGDGGFNFFGFALWSAFPWAIRWGFLGFKKSDDEQSIERLRVFESRSRSALFIALTFLVIVATFQVASSKPLIEVELNQDRAPWSERGRR